MFGGKRAFLLGMRDGAPFNLVVVPFGLLFGVAASNAGWSVLQIGAMSVFVIAGASQFTALQLMSDQAPVLVVVAAGLAVNLRMAMYSASLAPVFGRAPLWQRLLIAYALVDQSHGTTINRLALPPAMSPRERVAHFFGSALAICPAWYAASIAGAVAGTAIPPALALDFAVPITFIAIFAPSLRSLPHLAAAIVSIGVALALYGLPYQLWLLVASVAAMLTGAAVERAMERRE